MLKAIAINASSEPDSEILQCTHEHPLRAIEGSEMIYCNIRPHKILLFDVGACVWYKTYIWNSEKFEIRRILWDIEVFNSSKIYYKFAKNYSRKGWQDQL